MVDLPEENAKRTVVRRALREELLLDGLAQCYDGPPGCYGVTLGYAAPSSQITRSKVPP